MWLAVSGIPRRTLCAKLRRADELAADGKAGEEVAAELGAWRPRCTTGATPTTGSIPTRLSARAECPVEAAAGKSRVGEGRAVPGGEEKILSPPAKGGGLDTLT